MNSITLNTSSCPPKLKVRKRKLLSREQAAELAEVFKVLSGETRLIMLHALAKEAELSFTDFAERAGLKPSGCFQPASAPGRPRDSGPAKRRRTDLLSCCRSVCQGSAGTGTLPDRGRQEKAQLMAVKTEKETSGPKIAAEQLLEVAKA